MIDEISWGEQERHSVPICYHLYVYLPVYHKYSFWAKWVAKPIDIVQLPLSGRIHYLWDSVCISLLSYAYTYTLVQFLGKISIFIIFFKNRYTEIISAKLGKLRRLFFCESVLSAYLWYSTPFFYYIGEFVVTRRHWPIVCINYSATTTTTTTKPQLCRRDIYL